MSTVHIGANKEDIAKTVLMPGDPLRSRFIAENFLEDYRLVNNIRGVQGYTGFYNGKKVTVMASGMGMPSIGIYSYELFNYFDVEAIIRVGSAGAVDESVKIPDVVLGQAACTNGNYASQFRLPGTVAPIADFGLLMKAYETAVKMGIDVRVGNLLSSDNFYDDSSSTLDWQKMGVLAVEMEAAALYLNALRAKKKALAICTISDCVYSGEATTAGERQTSFTQMMKLALEIAE